jgi:ribose/xylose/arabinose/galactoside ABC-type transport system permease subunit
MSAQRFTNNLPARLYAVRIYGVLALTLVVAGILVPSFLQPLNLENTVIQASPNGLMALGETLVIFMGCIDLSVGSTLALSGLVAVILQGPLGPWPAVLVGVLSGTGVGVINGLVVTRLGVNAFIATLGTMTGIAGVSLMISGGNPISPPNIGFGLPMNNAIIWWLPPPTVAFVGLCILLHILVTRTRVGRNLMSVGGNREASRRAGLRPNAYVFGAYVACGTFAGLSGVMLALSLATGSPIIGSVSVLPVIASVVVGGASLLGGAGSVVKTGVGVLIIGSLSMAMDIANVSSWDQDIVLGGVLLFVVLMGTLGQGGTPGRLRGSTRRERRVSSVIGEAEKGVRLEESSSVAALTATRSHQEETSMRKEEASMRGYKITGGDQI